MVGLKEYAVHRVALGERHAVALVTSNRNAKAGKASVPLLFGWGDNTMHQIGPKDVFSEMVTGPAQLPQAEEIWGGGGRRWTADIAATASGTLAVSNAGRDI